MSNAAEEVPTDPAGAEPASGGVPRGTRRMAWSLSLSLRWLHVVANGRPAESPRPMQVGLLTHVVDPIGAGWGELRVAEPSLVSFEASAGSTVHGALLPGSREGGYPLFRDVEIPDVVRIDLLYVVGYQPDLGPVQLDPRARSAVVSLDHETAPRLMAATTDRLFLRVRERLVEEYGRATLLLDGSVTRWKRRFVVPLQLVARTAIRGTYVVPGNGGDGRPRGPVSFAEAGDVVASGEVSVDLAP